MAKGKKYWEVETPVEISTEKNVVKVYSENGKVQVFPKVSNTKYGIGKGATVDLEIMTLEELAEFRELVNKAIDMQVKEREVKSNESVTA